MYDILVSALQTLASVCDGAIEEDGVGFNGRDTKFGKSLAEQSLTYTLSEKQQASAIKMLQTYRKQLLDRGIQLPTITEYAGAIPQKEAVSRDASYQNGGRVPADNRIVGTIIDRRPTPQRVTGVTVDANEHFFIVSFPYNAELVARIKELPRRKFDPPTKTWQVPADSHAELEVQLDGYDVSWLPNAEALLNRTGRARLASTAKEAEIDVPNLSGTLLPFQKAGIAFLELAGGQAIIADEMGLGKTIQAIGHLALHPELRPAVIVCPASLKPNWRKEIAKWLLVNSNVHVVSGTKPYALPPETDIIVINYDLLTAWQRPLEILEPAVLICDEAHYLKTRTSQRTKAIQALAAQSKNVILMTGTPLMNRPVELYPLLNIVRPTQWSNYMAFTKRYCNGRQRFIGKKKIWDATGASNLEELNSKIKTIMVRRLKKDVLTELPAKRRVVVPIEIDTSRYNQFIENTIDDLKRAGNLAAQLVIIEKAKQYVVEQKIKSCLDWVEDFLESDEKLILFCWHRATAAALAKKFPDAVSITGDSSQFERELAVDSFQGNPLTKLFIGNIQAAGVGLTLTAASNVAFIELGWRPGDQTQAEDRAHRISQQNAVTAWYLLAEGTIEDDIYELLEKKRIVTETVMDGQAGDIGFNEGNVAQDLIEILTKRKGKK